MTALATSHYLPVSGNVARGSSSTAQSVERFTRQVIFGYKAKRADRALSLNELDSIYQERTETTTEAGSCLDDATYNLGKCFLMTLPTGYPAPEVSLHPDGELSFDWFGRSGRNFSASLRRDARVAYAGKVGPTSVRYGTEIFNSGIPASILDGIKAML